MDGGVRAFLGAWFAGLADAIPTVDVENNYCWWKAPNMETLWWF